VDEIAALLAILHFRVMRTEQLARSIAHDLPIGVQHGTSHRAFMRFARAIDIEKLQAISTSEGSVLSISPAFIFPTGT
jgi:ADP-ribosylglycohydrolase